MKSTMMHGALTLDRILERAVMFKDVAIISRRPDRSLQRTTYGDLYRRSRQLAQALLKAGLKPGDRVATLMWNHAAHLEAYFGVPIAGGVLHTLNLRLFPEDIAYIANHAGDRFLIVDDVLLPLYEKFRDDVPFERVLVYRFDGQQHACEDYEQFIASADGDFECPVLDENAPCGMCYTSGTTGKPKGVVYSHRSNILHALGSALPDAIGLSMRDTLLPIVPMFHANAWGLPYTATMVGCVQVFPGPHLDAESTIELMAQTQVTLAGAVPTVWMGVVQLLEQQPGRWKLADNVRLMVGGSAPPPALIARLARHGIHLHPAWGLTETSPLASFNRLRPQVDARPLEERLRYGAKAGLPLPLVDLRVVNEQGVAPWDGQAVGEIEVRGPWVTGSYYNRPDAADRFSGDGWFKTGDVAAMTPEGYITITDRAKDLIKSGGEWISSVDLENELMAHPAVAEAAVIAVAHEKWMERPLAVVVRKPGARLTAEELRAHLKGKFADWWLPDGYEFIDQIPRTSTGKFMKLKLREMFADGSKPGSTIKE
jgi:fatty-acyl-CoA synthase